MEKINKMEEDIFNMRKDLIIKKIDFIYLYEGTDGLKRCLDGLKEYIGLLHGNCFDFDKFKKYVLTSKLDLKEFIEFYSNTASDLSELMYIGTDDNCRVVEENKFYEEVCHEIKNYCWDNSQLYKYEEFLDNILMGY